MLPLPSTLTSVGANSFVAEPAMNREGAPVELAVKGGKMRIAGQVVPPQIFDAWSLT